MIEEIKNYKDLLNKIKSSNLEEKTKSVMSNTKKSLNLNDSSFLSNILKGNFFTPSVIWKIASFSFNQLKNRPKTILKIGKFAFYTFLFFKARNIWRFLKK